VQFITTGLHERILVIGSDVNSSIVNLQDRKVAALFGDGAGAVVVAPASGEGVIAQHLGADGGGGHLFSRPAGGSRMPPTPATVAEGLHYIHMDGRALFRSGVEAMVSSSLAVLEKAGLGVGDVDLFIPHQANMRMLDAGLDRLGIPRDRTVINLDRFGNTSAATIPIALDEALGERRLGRGDLLLLTGFGAGITWGSVLMKWDRD
jgi:3-oxoacyl-[acyl-carrier-protein] synthase-3